MSPNAWVVSALMILVMSACGGEVMESTAGDPFETTTPDAPETTTPDAPETTTPDAPETTTPDAPETTTPDAPETTTPDAPETVDLFVTGVFGGLPGPQELEARAGDLVVRGSFPGHNQLTLHVVNDGPRVLPGVSVRAMLDYSSVGRFVEPSDPNATETPFVPVESHEELRTEVSTSMGTCTLTPAAEGPTLVVACVLGDVDGGQDAHISIAFSETLSGVYEAAVTVTASA